MRRRPGYTLIEVLVAMVVFSAGGLALAAGSAVIGRTMAVNARRENATRLAVTRLEQICSSCESATSGADTAAAVHVRWNVAANASSVTVLETVSYPTPSGLHSETFRASFACP
jgi:prepilin-type N-terminal cleavage/methylation domain-containing protein